MATNEAFYTVSQLISPDSQDSEIEDNTLSADQLGDLSTSTHNLTSEDGISLQCQQGATPPSSALRRSTRAKAPAARRLKTPKTPHTTQSKPKRGRPRIAQSQPLPSKSSAATSKQRKSTDTFETEVLSLLRTLRTSLDVTNASLAAVQKTNCDLVSQLAAKTAECQSLNAECSSLRKQLNNKSSETRVTPNPASPSKTLLIGSSIIRDVDSSKLDTENVHTECIRGGKISDVCDKIAKADSTYDNIIFQIGSNDCAASDNAETIVDSYKLLLAGGHAIAKSISVSSICPRTDNANAHTTAQAVNAELQVLCENMENTNFVNNDSSFILQDGTVNEGFLNRDGLHLAPSGTNRLVYNMGLTKKVKSVTKPWNNHFHRNSQQNSHAHKDPGTRPQPSISPPPRVHIAGNNLSLRQGNRKTPNNSRPACFKCGEASHLASTCWHPGPVRCYSCSMLGHKTHKCPNNANFPCSNRF
ncbi:unnamed protein product [Owenia fusiformis]|uniref:Uncharacterized protein n=1 Tax=Owenia fusiformis TaxID=6347 RepID=A0A8J1TJ40_OWEFU|nr:unnamed protein product [Owenia fusiformis]